MYTMGIIVDYGPREFKSPRSSGFKHSLVPESPNYALNK
jgi:hypothetical protein